MRNNIYLLETKKISGKNNKGIRIILLGFIKSKINTRPTLRVYCLLLKIARVASRTLFCFHQLSFKIILGCIDKHDDFLFSVVCLIVGGNH